MARTLSFMMPLGTSAPAFALPDLEGRLVRLADLPPSPGLLVMFLANHCPYVKHLRNHLAANARTWGAQGLTLIGIASNDAVAYPDDGPDGMRAEIAETGYDFPYLIDAEQTVAKAFHAACTPDFFLFDRDRRLAYRGRYCASRPKQVPPQAVTGADLAAAVEAVLAGRPATADQRPSLGCNIKWAPGNEPDYATRLMVTT